LVEVVKRNGTKEIFDGTKIKRSIEKAAIDAGYTLEEVKTITKEITEEITEEAKKNGKINTEAVKDSIFNKFKKTDSSIVKSWNKFDAKYKPNL
jgi:transcriptional repressor NrdR